MKNRKLLIFNKENLFYRGRSKNTDWAIKGKDGNWWIVYGSEFPEKKTKKEDERMRNCAGPPTFNFKRLFARTAFSIMMGVALGIIIFSVAIAINATMGG